MRQDHGEWVIDEKSPSYEGFEVLVIEKWKPGVVRLHMRRVTATSGEFRLVYCSQDYAPIIPGTPS